MRSRIRAAAWAATGVLGGAVVAGVVVSQVGLANAGAPTVGRPAAATTPGFGPGMHMGMGGMGGRAIHGEATIEELDGDYVTVSQQRGKLTAVSATSITVKSDDGFTRTYAVNGDTVVTKAGAVAKIGDYKTGDTVGVQALKSGDGWVAKHVGDGTGPGRGKGRGHGVGRMMQQAPPTQTS